MQKSTKRRRKSTPRLLGDVVLFQTPIYNWVTALVCLIIATSIILLANGKYAKKTKVSGVITSTMGVAKVTAKAAGTIEKQFFRVGDRVNKGDVLYSISTKRQSLKSGDLDGSILKELRESKSILEDKIKNLRELTTLKTLSIEQEIQGKEKELSSLIEQNKLLKRSVKISKDMLDGLKKLQGGGLVSNERYNEFYDKDLNTQLKSEEMSLRISAVKNKIGQLKSDYLKQPIEAKIQENELQQSISSVNRQVIDVLARRDYTITSPADGVIATSLTKVGQIVRASQSLQTVLPEDALFQAEIYLPSHAIGFVRGKELVFMRYSAFPYQHYGLQKGVITEVSSVISQPAELEQGEVVSNPVYKAIVELDSQTVKAAGKKLPIHVGMTLEASISLDSRSIWEWIMEPIFSLKGEL